MWGSVDTSPDCRSDSGSDTLCSLERALVAERAENDTVPDRLDALAGRIRVRRLSVHGIQVLLAAGPGAAPASVVGAAAACERILRERSRG